eukprot:g7226.t1
MQYEACVNLEKPERVLAFEKYRNGISSSKIHIERDAHKELNQEMRKKKMTKYQSLPALSFYDIPNYGWWSRSNRSQYAHTILCINVIRFNCSWMLDEFQKISSEFSEYIWINEPETLIYSGGVTTTDTRSSSMEYDIKKGDFVSIVECANNDALKKHLGNVQDADLFQNRLSQAGVKMKIIHKMMYRTSGIGFMDRGKRNAFSTRL